MKTVPYVSDTRKYMHMFKSPKLDTYAESIPVQSGGNPSVLSTARAVTHIDITDAKRSKARSIKRRPKKTGSSSAPRRRTKRTSTIKKTVKRQVVKKSITRKKSTKPRQATKKRKSKSKRKTVLD